MRGKRSSKHSGDRRIHEPAPGRSEKLPELAGCPRCGASYREGRWTWKSAPAGSYEHVCPACERIESDYPAGVVRVEGTFVGAHQGDLVGLMRNVEEREKSEHPLKRIMAIDEDSDGLTVKVTDGKLALSLGRALKKAYDGQLDQPPTTADKENLVRVHWARD